MHDFVSLWINLELKTVEFKALNSGFCLFECAFCYILLRMPKITIQIMILFETETKIAVDERNNEKIQQQNCNKKWTRWFFEFDDERKSLMCSTKLRCVCKKRTNRNERATS